jgi:hypothetical protein
MTITIPDGLLELYEEVGDLFIDNPMIGVVCTIVYPEIKIPCPNCILNTFGGGSVNVYRTGGPYPFEGVCPYCNGAGFKLETSTEDIRLRVYFSSRDWIKVSNMQVVDGRVQCIGYLADSPKIRRANYINLVSEQSNYQTWSYKLASEPFPHGFSKRRYCIFFCDRT